METVTPGRHRAPHRAQERDPSALRRNVILAAGTVFAASVLGITVNILSALLADTDADSIAASNARYAAAAPQISTSGYSKSELYLTAKVPDSEIRDLRQEARKHRGSARTCITIAVGAAVVMASAASSSRNAPEQEPYAGLDEILQPGPSDP